MRHGTCSSLRQQYIYHGGEQASCNTVQSEAPRCLLRAQAAVPLLHACSALHASVPLAAGYLWSGTLLHTEANSDAQLSQFARDCSA